jgi:DNA replication protein DnaC
MVDQLRRTPRMGDSWGMTDVQKWQAQIDSQLARRGLKPASDERMARLDAEMMAEWREAKSEILLGRLNVRYRNALIRYGASQQWLDDYRAGTRRNLFMFGDPSTGKTWEACAIARRLLMEDSVPVGIITAPELMEALKPNKDGASDIGQFQVAPVLVLDDLGAERATEWSDSQLFLLVDDRSVRNLPTIVTTNLTGPQLRVRYGDRVTDRLAQDAQMVRTADVNYRNPLF